MYISVCDAAWGGGEADNVDLSLAQVDPQKNPHKILIKIIIIIIDIIKIIKIIPITIIIQ